MLPRTLAALLSSSGPRFSRATLAPVDTAAALASGSAPLPSLPQPWASALPLLLGSPFEATRQPYSGLPRLRICAPTRSQVPLEPDAARAPGRPKRRGGAPGGRSARPMSAPERALVEGLD